MIRALSPVRVAFVAGAMAGFLHPSSPAAGPQLTFDLVFGEETAGMLASDLQWSPDGLRLAYRWKEEGKEALWLLDVRDPTPARVLAPGLAGASEELEIAGYRWSPDGSAFLIEAGGDLYLLRIGDQLRRLTTTGSAEREPAFSPDGTKVAFVRDDDLHLIDLGTGQERRLTHDGEANARLNGVTDWVYWEEIWNRDSTGFWWSPDGAKIAYYQFDEEPVGTYPLLNPLPLYPEVRWQKYPKAGTANPRVRLGVLDLASGATTWLHTGPDPAAYLARLHWHPDGARVAVQRLNREQDRLDVLLCEVAGGSCATILTETWPTWVNLGDEFTWLPDGRFVWGSERSGWRRLYLYDGDGALARALTDGDPAVTSLDAVSGEGGWFVYTTHAPGEMGAAERQVRRGRLGGGRRETLAGESGWNGARVAPKTGYWVHAASTADDPTAQSIRDPRGRKIADLPAAPPAFDPAGPPRWEYLQIDGPDGSRLPAQRLLPAGLDGSRRYPVVMYHYGGPGSQVVANQWGGRRGLWHKMMAERGYVVLAVDNQGSAFFGKAGEDRMHRRFGPLDLAAQRAAVDHLKALPYVDPERIGLWGWSGGGSATLDCLLRSPGTWRAGVAGAPVTDWRLYDTIWTERYLDHPDDNPEGYEQSSPLTHAAELADALLLVHGTADDNVHPQNTLVMSRALIAAGKPFEQAIHPSQTHGFQGSDLRHFYERMTEFFDRHLRPSG
jgi:dipeptidyl-peptidase-4